MTLITRRGSTKACTLGCSERSRRMGRQRTLGSTHTSNRWTKPMRSLQGCSRHDLLYNPAQVRSRLTNLEKGSAMPQINVAFTFHSGLKRHLFSNVRLFGSWNAAGIYSSQWTETPMAAALDGTGCDAFSAGIALDATQTGTTFQWGVMADLAGSPNAWVIVTETPDPNSSETTR